MDTAVEADQLALGAVEEGRRARTVEWGVRHPDGTVDAADSQEHAEAIVAYMHGLPAGEGLRVVRRTVVTYKTPWFWWQHEQP